MVAGMSVSCLGHPPNVNAPDGNSIVDRYEDFMKVVAHARTMHAGAYSWRALPPELQLKNLLTVYVDRRKVYALEFPSHPVDSNPIYVFVDEDVPDPEGVVRAVCSDHQIWRLARKLDEKGWYLVYGP
jgi:hypothetical protein